jgi:hypothetical protein
MSEWLPHVLGIFSRVPSQNPVKNGLDARLMHVRKFRRRRTHFVFNRHWSVAFLSDPSAQVTRRYFSAEDLLLSREPDPLVHPPA